MADQAVVEKMSELKVGEKKKVRFTFCNRLHLTLRHILHFLANVSLAMVSHAVTRSQRGANPVLTSQIAR